MQSTIRHTTRSYAPILTTKNTEEIKTYTKRNDAGYQIKEYRQRLQQQGKRVDKMRIHLFDVERSGATQQGVEEFESLCRTDNITVTREPEESFFY